MVVEAIEGHQQIQLDENLQILQLIKDKGQRQGRNKDRQMDSDRQIQQMQVKKADLVDRPRAIQTMSIQVKEVVEVRLPLLQERIRIKTRQAETTMHQDREAEEGIQPSLLEEGVQMGSK